ncbi:MAG: TonB-dependent receptor [Flavobacteriaceae bacterium]|nr:TonB-dependent receptor [Flavobacteriaceae bacterium]
MLGINDTASDVFGIKANNRSYESRGIQSVANFNFGNHIYSDIEIGIRYHEDEEDRFQWTDRFAFENMEMVRTTVATKGTESNRISSAKSMAAHVLYKVTINHLTITPGLRYEDMTFERMDYGKSDPDRTGSNLKTSENNVNVYIPGIGANYIFSNDLTLFGGIHKGFATSGQY